MSDPSVAVTCAGCGERWERVMGASYPGTEIALARDGWLRTRKKYVLCPECARTPDESCALIALRSPGSVSGG